MSFRLDRKQILLFVGVLVVATGLGFGLSSLTQRHSLVRADGTHIIELRSNGATPDAIAVVKGSYVEFDVKDKRTYNIGQGSGNDEVHQQAHADIHDHPKGAIESGAFGPGQGYRVLFNKTGTFQFHDHLNPKISITVIVYEPKH